MQTITEHIKLIKSLREQSNENILKIFMTLSAIEQESLWKSKNYYKGQSVLTYEECSKMDFSSLIKIIFGFTRIWFESISNILSLDNGKELLLKYGRNNATTYYSSTEEERAAILNEVEKKQRLTPFAAIKRELYPSAKKEVSTINPWEQKYKGLKEKYEAMKREFDAYKKSVESFMAGMRKVS